MSSGAILLDKPSGISSARAVAQVKRLLPKKTKVGHTGTLDPLASGLLVLLIGRATRLSRYVTGLDKTYTAIAHFGATSDTLDADGEIVDLDLPMPGEEDLRSAARRFAGEQLQVPPMASAIKIGGRRLYELQRQGMSIERESRPVTIHSMEIVSIDLESRTVTFEVSCSSGTYVRSLVADLASSLDTGAYLTALRRTSVGHFDLRDAIPPDELDTGTIEGRIIHPAKVLSHLDILEADENIRKAVCNGRVIEARELHGSFRVVHEGELLAVYRGDGAVGRAEAVLCGG